VHHPPFPEAGDFSSWSPVSDLPDNRRKTRLAENGIFPFRRHARDRHVHSEIRMTICSAEKTNGQVSKRTAIPRRSLKRQQKFSLLRSAEKTTGQWAASRQRLGKLQSIALIDDRQPS
jgi:hypothetical protein